MNDDLAHKIVREIEAAVDVESVKYGDFQVWPHIKACIFFAVINPERWSMTNARFKGNDTDQQVPKSFYKRIFEIPTGLNRYLSALARVKKQFKSFEKFKGIEVLFIIENDSIYFDKVDDERYCRYLDPYYEVIQKKYKTAFFQISASDSQNDKLIKVNAFNNSDFVFVNQVRRRIKRMFGNSEASRIENFELIEKILSKYGVSDYIDHNMMVGSFEGMESMVSYYQEMIKAIRPKLIVENCYYKQFHMYALNYAASSMNVPTMEIQHGISEAIFYHTNDQDCNIYPDYFWVWSEYDKGNIERSKRNGKKLTPLVGGNMWLKKFVTDEMVNSTDNDFIEQCRSYKKVLLITLQHTLDIPEFLSEVMKKGDEDWLWLVRFHPLTPQDDIDKYRKYFDEVGKDNIEIENATRLNLYDILKWVDVHITSHSAVAVEAASFNVPTILIDDQVGEYFQELIRDEICVHAYEAPELMRFLKSGKKIEEEKYKYYKMGTNENAAIDVVDKVVNSQAHL